MKDSVNIKNAAKTALSEPHFAPLNRVLIERFSAEATQLRTEIDISLEKMLQDHWNDAGALREESHNYILPSIAIYLSLKNAVGETEALTLFRRVFFETAYSAVERLREKAKEAGFVLSFLNQMLEGKDGAHGGFIFKTLQKDVNDYEFHVLRCPYCDYCTDYGCTELIPVFCECDDIIYGDTHPKLLWKRKRTLGRGDALCDFRFERIGTK